MVATTPKTHANPAVFLATERGKWWQYCRVKTKNRLR
jgi:alkaline phosphatase